MKIKTALTAMSFTAQLASAGVINTTIDAALNALGKTLGCHFSLETLSLSNGDNPSAFWPVDFEAIKLDTDPIKFIETRFPEYSVTAVPGQANYYRVFDIRVLQCHHYPLEFSLQQNSFDGTQQQLIASLSGRVPQLSAVVMTTSGRGEYASSATPISIEPMSGTVREILNKGSKLVNDEFIVWRSYGSGTIDKITTEIGYYGRPAFSPQ